MEQNKIGPNTSFILLMLQTLRSCEVENEDPVEMIPFVIEGIKAGRITGCEGYDPCLMENFEKGWNEAVRKYGADIAPSRMKAFLIETLIECSATPITKEEILSMIDRAWDTASLLVRGIHLTKDEDGNYHEERDN